jgi:predicted nuclease of predicted toxin-antitoxin system
MSNINIVIDESVDYQIVNTAKQNGLEVFAIIDENPSISDTEVLSIANKKKALLITEDKDFGELVFRFQLSHNGILLVRMPEVKSLPKAEIVLKTILEYYDEMINNFSVLDKNKLRIKK